MRRDVSYEQSRVLFARLSRILKAIHEYFKDVNAPLSPHTDELVSCSNMQLWTKLEEQFDDSMQWESYGTTWQIALHVPCSAFDLSDETQRRICFHYSNLEPLMPAQIRARQGHYTEQDKQALIERVVGASVTEGV